MRAARHASGAAPVVAYCPYCERDLTALDAFTHAHDQYRALGIWEVGDGD